MRNVAAMLAAITPSDAEYNEYTEWCKNGTAYNRGLSSCPGKPLSANPEKGEDGIAWAHGWLMAYYVNDQYDKVFAKKCP